MQKIYFLLAGLLLGGLSVFLLPTQAPLLVDAQSWYGLSMATFTDGTTYLAYRDYDYSNPTGPSWTINAEVPAIPNSDPQYHAFQTPIFTHQGDRQPWSHDVFTYDDAESSGCMRNVLYIDRVHRTMETHRLETCVTDTLDIRDVTTFIGIDPMTETQITLGTYKDGLVLAKTTLPSSSSFVAANWENTKILLRSGSCNIDEETATFLLWDTTLGTVTDVGSQLSVPDCTGYYGDVFYNRDTDAFDVYSPNDQPEKIGSVK